MKQLNTKNREYYRSRMGKSYLVLPDELIELYRARQISAVDVKVYAYLCSLRTKYNGVRVSQKRIALMCGITEKTVSQSVWRLYESGLIRNVIIEVVKRKIKYKTSIYELKPLPSRGFFFCLRKIFNFGLNFKMFAVYLFLCSAHSFEYGKSWNSYNDILFQLGFNKGQRSELVALIGGLAKLGLVRKTVRQIKRTFVDNIYRVTGFDEVVKKKSRHEEKRPAVNGTLNLKTTSSIKSLKTKFIIPQESASVKPLYMQLRLDWRTIYCPHRLLFCCKWGGV